MDASVLEHRNEILDLARKRGAHNVRIFGSRARGHARANSDLDVLIDLEPGRSLFDVGGLLNDLEHLLGYPDDVVTASGLHWYIRDRVLAEAVPL